MENYHVEVKRPTGRPRLPKADPATEAKRAKWRARARDRYASANLSDSNSPAARQAFYEQLVKEHGGKCVITGTTENLEFHHVIPSQMKFRISGACSLHGLGNTGFDRVRAEADKCVLICRREHTKIHSRVNAEIRAIKKETTLTKKGERGLRDYYTQKYTKQAILIAELKRM